jgi:nicotinate (nicotinamide) nucleotide adenylyltransferase
MEFIRRAAGTPSRLGVLPGSFHPPTRAHLALARAALGLVDEVVFVLPRAFPHKRYEGVGLAERLRLVETATAGEPRFSVAVSDGGLFLEIARECRAAYGPAVELWFVCGRDAAERILNWDYGRPGVVQEMLEEFGLLVADRHGRYTPPPELAGRIRHLPLPDDHSDVSATEVRNRIRAGRPWEHLVPEPIVELVRRFYRPSASDTPGA